MSFPSITRAGATAMAVLAASAAWVSAAGVQADESSSLDAALNQIENTAVDTAAKAAAEACKGATRAAIRLQPGVYNANDDFQAAQASLAPIQDKLHLASVALQNTNCAALPANDAACVEKNAAYDSARNQLLALLPQAQAAERAYLKSKQDYGQAVAAANQVCLVQLAAQGQKLSSQWDAMKTVFSGLGDLVGSVESGLGPDLGPALVDLIPHPRLPQPQPATAWAGDSWYGDKGRSQYSIRLDDTGLNIKWTTDGQSDGEYYECKLEGAAGEIANCKWRQAGIAGGTVHLVYTTVAVGDRISGKAFDGQDSWDVDIFREH